MLGVTVLILVISVMTGFDRELRQKVIDFDAHILVTGEEVLTNWRDLQEKIRATPRVVATAPYVQGPVIVEHNEQRLAPLIRGIDPEQEEKVVTLQKFVKWGKLDLNGDSTVLGIELARQLNATVGDTVTVYSPGNLSMVLDRIKKLENATGEEEKKAIAELREVVLPKDLTVTGIFETGHYVHDSQYLLVPLFIGQELYGLGDALHGITVKTQDPYDVDQVKAEIDKFLDVSQVARTGAECDVLSALLHRRRRRLRNHEHADHCDRAKTSRNRNHESARSKYRANCLGLLGTGNGGWIFRNPNGTWTRNDTDSLSQRI